VISHQSSVISKKTRTEGTVFPNGAGCLSD
jgi:hypothetical protein